MKYIVCVVLLLAGLAMFVVMLWPDKQEFVQPTGNPGVMIERPTLFGGNTTVIVADSAGRTEPVIIEDAGEVAVTVTVEADTTGDPVQILIDRPAPAWFPEAISWRQT